MRGLQRPNFDDRGALERLLRGIRSPAQRTSLMRFRNAIIDAYNRYGAPPLQPDLLPPGDAQYMRARFNGRRGIIGDVKAAVFESFLATSASQECPYCLIGEANTFDHVLPNRQFAHYCHFSSNLIPACSKCNTAKGDQWDDGNGDRAFLHLYLDTLPSQALLVCELSLDDGGVSTIAYRPTSDRSTVAIRYAELFKQLKLASRFQARAIPEWERTLGRLAEIDNRGLGDFREWLVHEAQLARQAWGIHSWQYTLLAAGGRLNHHVLNAALRIRRAQQVSHPATLA